MEVNNKSNRKKEMIAQDISSPYVSYCSCKGQCNSSAEPETNNFKGRNRCQTLNYVHTAFICVLIVSVLFLVTTVKITQDEQVTLRNQMQVLQYQVQVLQTEIHPRALRRRRRSARLEPIVDPPIVYDFSYGVHDRSDEDGELSKYNSLLFKKKEKLATSSRLPKRTRTTTTTTTTTPATTTSRPHMETTARRLKSSMEYEIENQPPRRGNSMSSYARRVNTFRNRQVARGGFSGHFEQRLGSGSSVDGSDQRRNSLHSKEFKRPQTKSLLSSLPHGEDLSMEEADEKKVALHLFHDIGHSNSTDELNVSGLHQRWRKSLEIPRRTFSVKQGKITIPETGVYYVYAQIEYSNSHLSNSFDVYRGDKTVLTCVTSIHASPPPSPSSPLSGSHATRKGANQNRHSTCFTARIVKLKQGDILFVRDKMAGRRISGNSSGSFFGMWKI